MKKFEGASLVRVGLATASLAGLMAGCGQSDPPFVSSTLRQPVEPGDGYGLAQTLDGDHVIDHLAVAGNSLFFEIPWGGIYMMPKYGGDITPVDREAKTFFLGLATSGDQVLWLRSESNGSALLRRSVNGGPSTRLRQGKLDPIGFNNTNILMADSNHVYFVAAPDVRGAPGPALDTGWFIDVTPIAGGPAEQVPLPEMAPVGFSVAAAYPSVYFTSCQPVTPQCLLERVDLPGETAQVVASVPDYAQIVAVDQDAVYLLDGRTLWSIARATGAETELVGLATGIHPTTPAAVDSQSVYFFGTEPGATLPALRLMSVPKAGGAPAIIGRDERLNVWQPWDLAVDDQFAFVVTSPREVDDGNEILAFPKTLPPSP